MARQLAMIWTQCGYKVTPLPLRRLISIMGCSHLSSTAAEVTGVEAVLADTGRRSPASEVTLTDYVHVEKTLRCAHQMNAHTYVFCVWVQSVPRHITRVPITAHLFTDLWTHDGLMPHSLRAQKIPLLSTRMLLFGQTFTLYKSTHDSWRAVACEGVLKNIWPPHGLTICL